jgi:hypothetical protein
MLLFSDSATARRSKHECDFACGILYNLVKRIVNCCNISPGHTGLQSSCPEHTVISSFSGMKENVGSLTKGCEEDISVF